MMKDDLPAVLIFAGQMTRDFNSKLVIAAALAARNCRAIIAQKEVCRYIGKNSDALVFQGRGIVKRINQTFVGNTLLGDSLQRNGSAVVYHEEEGAMFASDSWKAQVLGKHRIEGLRLRETERICVWGEAQKHVITDYAKEMESCLRVTGSPRFDICAPRFDWMARDTVQKIRNRFGSFILACTRFSSIANKGGIEKLFLKKLAGSSWPQNLERDEFRDFWFSKWRQDVHDLAEFVALVKELAAEHPDRQIVLRPHAGEDWNFYRHAFAQSKNVTVIHEGNVMNWIRAADLVVHTNCSTGIEAVLAGRPVLNFLPRDKERPRLNVEVAVEAGVAAGSIPKALEEIKSLLDGKRPIQAWSARARGMLNNLQQDAIPVLVDETLSVIRERGIHGSRLKFPGSNGARAREIIRKCRGRPKPEPGGFDLEHIETVLDGCQANGIGAARIRKLTPKYVVIDPV